MSNISNITSKILKDAEVERESILAAADKEKNTIVSKREASARELEKEILEKAHSEAKLKKERVISGAKLKVRNNKLTEKQLVIESIFEESIDKLCSMKDEDFISFLTNSIMDMQISGDETIILNKDGLKLIGFELIDDINKKLTDKGLKGELKLSKKEGNFKGGFILEKDGIEINNTFEALVTSLRDELEFEVAKVLFN